MEQHFFEYLPWDSEHFGIRIGRIGSSRLTAALVAAVEEWAHSQKIDCLYLLAECDPATMRLASGSGFRFVDIRSTFEINISQHISSEKGWPFRMATVEDLPELRRIAGESHRGSRFYADGNFSPAACDELYRAWIEKSVRDTNFATAVMVAEAEGRAVGYISSLISGDRAQIGLVGLDSDHRGRGWGEKLVHHALSWLSNQGAMKVTVVTQGSNISAQRLYQKCGFLVSSVDLWYHRWF